MMSAIYNSATGLKTMSVGMNVVSNNLANVGTLGFKKTMLIYQDLSSNSENTSSNGITEKSQTGHGVQLGDTHKLFTQGSFSSGSSSTDLGIDGIGFFAVQDGDDTYYTRAGNFRFTKDGKLNDPSGYTLLGYRIETDGTKSAAQPIILDKDVNSAQNTIAPQATSHISLVTQLGALENKSSEEDPLFFSMASKWDATKQPALSSGNYSYSQPVQFYDDSGSLVNATMYFNLAGKKNGSTVAEYVLALDQGSVSTNKSEGLLMAGTLSFNSSGAISNMTAFTPSGNEPSDLTSWTPATLKDGSPVFNVTTESGSQSIALNMGLTLTSSTAGLGSASELATNESTIYEQSPGATLNSSYSYARGTSNGSLSQKKDGWTSGELTDVTINEEGYVIGKYSNGQTKNLYQIPLYRFANQDGLRSEGANHYSATTDSGAPTEGAPRTENFGSVIGGQLEMSNVDHGEEIVNMITTQRGFQMNSKVLMTADTMLQKAMEIKR